jgi:hypothetical protein
MPTDQEIMARQRMLGASRVKKQSGMDWLDTNYGMASGPRMREVYNILKKTRGAAATDLLRKYGGQRRMMGANGRTTTKEPINPMLYKMLNDFIEQRNAYHNAKAGATVPWEEAYQSLLIERGLL